MEKLSLKKLNKHLSAFGLALKKEDFFETIDSTFNAKGQIVVAKSQTNGTGRLGRSFFCASGGIYLCVRTKIIPLLTISAAAGILRLLESENILASVKWINDIIFNGKKLCGILAKSENETQAVVGVGLNYCVNIPDELAEIATSLKTSTKGINEFAAKLIYFLFDAFNRQDNLEYYKTKIAGLNKQIILPDKSLATFIDINEQGNLIYFQNNKEGILSYGDISL